MTTREKARAYNRRYYQKNKDKCRAYQQQYYWRWRRGREVKSTAGYREGREYRKSSYNYHDIMAATPEKLVKILERVRKREAILTG